MNHVFRTGKSSLVIKTEQGEKYRIENGPEREAAGEAGKAVRGGNIGYIKKTFQRNGQPSAY